MFRHSLSNRILLILRWCSYIKVGSSLHLKLIHSGTGLGNIDLVVILARHSQFLLFIIILADLHVGPLGIARIV